MQTESFDKDSLALIQLGLQQAKKYYERAIQLYKVQDTYLEKAKCMIEYAEVLEKDSLYDACLSVLNEVNKIKNLTFSIRCDLKYRMAFHATSIEDYALSNKYLEELEIDLYNHVTENLYEKRVLNVDERDALYLKRYNMYKLGQVDAYNKLSEELIDSYVLAKELNDKVLDTVYQQTLPKILEERRNSQSGNDDQKRTNPKSQVVLGVINIAIIVIVFVFMLVAFTLFNFYSHYLPKSLLDEYLFLSKSKKVLMKNIVYVHKETGTNYSTFYLQDSTDNLRTRVSLVNLFSQDEEEGREALPTNIFLKIHSSYVINMFEVDDLIPNTDSIRMRDGSIVKISRDEKDLLIEKIRAATSNQNKLVLVFREFLKDKSEGFPMAKKYLTKYRQPKGLDTDAALHQT